MTGYPSQIDPNSFYHWMMELANDARKRGCLGRFRRSSDFQVWHHVWAQGVHPTIAAVLAWCLQDPERFEDLRMSENTEAEYSTYRMAA